MNGRCKKDALDRAEDICELCGNQYCAGCLLFPRGHRSPPTCKTCALEHSGLRGGSSKYQTLSKREYKKRKKLLLEQLEDVEEKTPAIEFFELKDPSEFDRSNELDRRAAVPDEGPRIDILAAGEDALEPSSPAPNAAAPPPPQPPTPQVASTPHTAPAAPVPAAPTPESTSTADHTMTGLAPVDTSINPLALGGSPSPAPPAPAPVAHGETSEASSSAAELLARLKADQPIQSQFTSAPVGLDIDPFAAPTSDLAAPRPRAEVAVPTALTPPPSLTPPASPTPAPINAAPINAAPINAAPINAAPINAAPPATRPKSEPWSPPTPPPRGSNLDTINDAPINSAPINSAPINSAPINSAPINSERFNPDHESSLDEMAFEPVPPTTEPHPTRRKADTDDSGQWIPPSLRGMATPEERDPLPKRRS